MQWNTVGCAFAIRPYHEGGSRKQANRLVSAKPSTHTKTVITKLILFEVYFSFVFMNLVVFTNLVLNFILTSINIIV